MQSLLRMCLVLGMATAALAEDSWQVTMASLWGDGAKQEMRAVAVDDAGIAYVGGAPHRVVPGAGQRNWFAAATGPGSIMAVDTALGEVLWTAPVPHLVQDLVMAHDGYLLVLAGGVHKIDLQQDTVLWSVGGGGRRVLCDGAGGAWTFDGRQARHLDDQGQQVRSVPIRGRDLAVDTKGERLFTCGWNSGRSTIKQRNPVHVPWVRAFDFDGNRLWQMWGFTPTQVDEVGDMADSHPQRLFFSANGHLYMFGDSDGGNTPYRHSPHQPGGSVGDALRGTPFNQMWRAFRSVRMLFVARIDPATGNVLRGSFFYGMWHNDEQNRDEIGDAEALGLYVDAQDRVYLTGVMRCAPPRTAHAVHRQAAPVDRRGYWNNRVATDEAYLAIIDDDFTTLSFASGFNQNGSPRAWSRGLAVAAGGDGAVMVGTVRIPEETHAVEDLHYLHAPVQDQWGGDHDGYVAVLHRGDHSLDPVGHVRRTVAAVMTGIDDERVSLLTSAEVFAPWPKTVSESDDPLGQRLRDLMGRLESQVMGRIANRQRRDPYAALHAYTAVVEAWSGAPLAEAAAEQITALRDDPVVRVDLKAGQDRDQALGILDGLQEVPRAEMESLLDRAYAQRNGRVLQRFQGAAQAMHQRFPDHRFTEEVLAVAAQYAVPVTAHDQELVGHYGALMQLRQQLRFVRGVRSSYEDPRFRAMNEAVLNEMQSVLRTMRRMDARHVFTGGAEDLLAALDMVSD